MSDRFHHQPGSRHSRARIVVRRVLAPVLVIWLALVALIAGFQRKLLYFPHTARSVSAEPLLRAGLSVERVRAGSDSGDALWGWHITHPAQAADRGPPFERPVFLYFCGNAGHRGYRVSEFLVLADLGAEVVCFDYRGYGENNGQPTEEGLAGDARSAWNFVTGPLGIDRSRIILLGESLGGAVAVRLAAEVCQAGTPPAALVVRSSWSRLEDVAATHYPWIPVRWLLVDRYDSGRAIVDVTCPILVIHGARDTIVPIELGEQLFTKAPATSSSGTSCVFVRLPEADHNDILDAGFTGYRDALKALLEDVSTSRSRLAAPH